MGVYILETGIGGQGRIKKKWEKSMTIQQQARLAPQAHWVMLWYSLRQLPPRTFCSYQSVLSALCNTLATGHKGLLINWNVDSTTEQKNFNSSNWKDFISNCVSVCGFVHVKTVCGGRRALDPMELELLVLLKAARCGSSGRPASALTLGATALALT